MWEDNHVLVQVCLHVIERHSFIFQIFNHFQFSSVSNSELGDIGLVLTMKGLSFAQQDLQIFGYKIPTYSPQTGVCVLHQSFSTREDTL